MNRRSFCRTMVWAGAGLMTLGWRSGLTPIRRSTLTMGSLLDVQVYNNSDRHAHHAIGMVFDEFRRLDDLLSVYKPNSLVSSINAQAGRAAVCLPPDIFDLFALADSFRLQTDGRFNVLVEPMMRLWGFRSDSSTRRPSDAQIERAIAATKPGNLILNPREGSVGLANHDAAIDLGGIAVGYALDRAAVILRSLGIEHALLNHSGDLLAIGAPPGEPGWPVAIVDPVHPTRFVLRRTINNEALSTSGNYEAVRTIEDRIVGHLFDPDSGLNPGRFLSLTIISPSAVEADALSTGCYCGAEFVPGIRWASVEIADGEPKTRVHW